MIDRLRRAVRYILNLGFVEGLSLYLQVEILVLAQNVIGRGDSVVAINSAVWSSNCFLKFKDDEASHWMKEVEECDTREIGAFKAVSLNWLIDRYGLERIDLVKLDVEGTERAIFHANYEWIGRTKFILPELHDWLKRGCSNAFFRAISHYNVRTSILNGMVLLENLDQK
jgi:FkbM family methyltransferase